MAGISRMLLCAGLALLSLRPTAAYSPDTWTPASVPAVLDAAAYGEPVWSDEFDGNALDTSKWYAQDVAWPHNDEKQYYTPDAVSVADGKLRIHPSRTPMNGRDYSSGRIETGNSVHFRHGLFAARVKMTYSQGLWPAWWLFGTGRKYAEFDIAELAGGVAGYGSADDASSHAVAHFSVFDMPTANVTRLPVLSFHAPEGQKFADDFYTFWMEWTPTTVTVGMDDRYQTLVADVSAIEGVPYDSYMYLILNVAIGGGYPGDPDQPGMEQSNPTVLPQDMEVEWVRVWAKNGEDIMRVPPPSGGGDGGDGGDGSGSGEGPNDTTSTGPTDNSGDNGSGSGSGTDNGGGNGGGSGNDNDNGSTGPSGDNDGDDGTDSNGSSTGANGDNGTKDDDVDLDAAASRSASAALAAGLASVAALAALL